MEKETTHAISFHDSKSKDAGEDKPSSAAGRLLLCSGRWLLCAGCWLLPPLALPMTHSQATAASTTPSHVSARPTLGPGCGDCLFISNTNTSVAAAYFTAVLGKSAGSRACYTSKPPTFPFSRLQPASSRQVERMLTLTWTI